jgi:hypothetical protein
MELSGLRDIGFSSTIKLTGYRSIQPTTSLSLPLIMLVVGEFSCLNHLELRKVMSIYKAIFWKKRNKVDGSKWLVKKIKLSMPLLQSFVTDIENEWRAKTFHWCFCSRTLYGISFVTLLNRYVACSLEGYTWCTYCAFRHLGQFVQSTANDHVTLWNWANKRAAGSPCRTDQWAIRP